MAKIQPKTAISVNDFEVLGVIGSGSYGTVKKVMRLKDKKIFVWKELDYSSASESDKQMLVSEVNLLRELKHENIVKYVDRIIDRKKSILFLIMEYCEGGDLASYIAKVKKEGSTVEEQFIWKVCYQLTQAIKECHSRSKYGRSVLHRDLKPANIFLDSQLNVKLGDFGLARVLKHETSFAKTCVGTPLYMSPEQMSGMEYNEKSDMWALGCLLYELCSLRPPFVANNQIELAAKICMGKFDRISKNYSIKLYSLICSLLDVDVEKRPSIEVLLQNSALLNYHASNENNKMQQHQQQQNELDNMREEIAQLKNDLLVKKLELKKREKDIEVKEKEIEKRLTDIEAEKRI
ncbi:hypothetical protein HELRODRAFT_103696 [Helobdella robusta]|uniref:non-specific serine/threonine protein kinase n=1 Tax=Helobdella robusta TaxID=6412 RepID=T1EDG8_HELRO|nr:hypothetical protein HELRODRAFT_103696 [Helobdella robusta]ESN92492.1 hypothetical protein HELRODRAFT_103696 [Helobdella robusta]